MPSLINNYGVGDVQLQVEDSNVDCMNRSYEVPLRGLFPPGPWWNFKRDGVLYNLFNGLSKEFVRVSKGVDIMVRESNPSQAVYTIGDWETDLALPGNCLSPPETLEDRRGVVIAKLQRRKSYGREYILAIATSLGYANPDIRLEGNPFTCTSGCIDGLRGFEGYWLSTFTLLVTSNLETDSVLECLVSEAIRNTEFVFFEYS